MARAGGPKNQHGGAVLVKLSKKARKLTTRRVTLPWQRKARGRRKLTYGEKKALLARRKEKKTQLNERLDAVRELIFQEALKLADEFPGHDAKYYYRLIFQQSHLKFGEPRDITMWNAFVSLELTKYNNGKFITSIHSGAWLPLNFGRSFY